MEENTSYKIHIQGFVGQVQCPKDGFNVTVYLSKIKPRFGDIKFYYDCILKNECKKEYCPLKDAFSESKGETEITVNGPEKVILNGIKLH